MTRIIVLIKLVPDIRHIPEDAWDLRRGTLRRNRLQLVPNPYDDRALALALQIRNAWGGEVTALSMGPPEADSLCSRALAFGADKAVLVSDPVCAGSDTLATSAVLARAIERLCDTTRETLILSGMQSPDGDTAQVPIQVAARLGASVIPYVTLAGVTPEHADLTSITSGQDARTLITRRDLPAVVTCTEQLPSIPFHTPLSQLGRAVHTRVRVLTAAELDLSPDEVGLAGSATRVVTISVASSVRRESELIDWGAHGDSAERAAHIVDRIADALAGNSAGAAGDLTAPSPSGATSGGTPGDSALSGPPGGYRFGPHDAVWAVVGNRPDADRLGILAHARQIADAMGCPTVACIVGDDRPAVAQSDDAVHEALGAAGATETLVVTGISGTDPVGLALALEQAVAKFRPRVLLLPASPEGRVTAPYLAARLGAGLTADCTSFVVKDFTVRASGERHTFPDALYQKRPALGGNIEATIVSPKNISGGMPQMATVRPGPTLVYAGLIPVRKHRWAAEVIDPREGRAGSTNPTPGAGPASDDHPTGSGASGDPGGHASAAVIYIERCKILVSVGRGVGGERGIEELARPLAEALRNRFAVDVEVAASRMVVDAGHLERDRQVGQTGKTVAPDIYIALGISGSAQHRAGMEGSAAVVSVNSDADAPIRVISDLFVHGRVQDVVPALIDALTRAPADGSPT